jgi:anti-sigma-K factor RskA
LTAQYEIETIRIMKTTKDKKDNTFLYIISTLSFVLLGIILTTVIDQTKSKDVRTRASATTGINATAVVTAIDSETNTITVNQLAFNSNENKALGSWVITPPSSFVVSSVIPGNTIAIKIDPTHFDIQNHTITVKGIKKK